MPENFQEKTEQPTSKRLEDARKEGNVAQSMDLSAAAVLATGVVALWAMGGNLTRHFIESIRAVFVEMPTFEVSPDNIGALFFKWASFYLNLILPFVIVVMAIGLAVGLLQTKFNFSTKSLSPDLKRLNPISNFKQKYSVRALVELVKGLLKLIIVGMVGYFTVKSEIAGLVLLADSTTAQMISAIGAASLKIALRVVVAYIIIAVLDYMFQAWKYKRDLRMSKQEVKDEHRQMDGDPQIKSRIRSIQLKASLNRMIKAVPTADVVVTNPTHVAVALKYDPQTMTAPKVVAKGKRKLAARIKELARENNIPVIEEPELARALYKTTDVNVEIPFDLYQAVAEVLALVYKLRQAA